MGAGKTTVGKLLAEKFDMPFADLDDVIEKKTDLTIPMIFEKHGEKYFRHLEADTLQRIAQYPGNIVATGGGIILSAKNRKIMKDTGTTVYLKWQTNILCQRIKNSKHRPLLKGKNESQLIRLVNKILEKRRPFYEQADIIIEGNEGATPGKIVALIIQKLPLIKNLDF
jgi:shikimate kinase